MRIGTDICHLLRLKTVNEHFIDRILTDSEKEIYHQKSEEEKLLFLGGRWAAKEAIFKATGAPDYLKHAVLNDAGGAPYVENHPEIKISVSHDGEYAVAFVLVEDHQ